MSAPVEIRGRPFPPPQIAAKAGEPRTVKLRRLIVVALGLDIRDGATEHDICDLILQAPTPDAAAGAVIAVALAVAGQGSPRLQALGALAIPGWDAISLEYIAERLVLAAPKSLPEIVALRQALRGRR